MAVYYKFKSAKDYDSIPIDGHFISVANLKEKIFESKHLGRGTDFDLMVANAQTNEEYHDEATLIPKNTSVLVRRIPGRPRMPIVTEREEPKVVDSKEEDIQSGKNGIPLADPSVMIFPEETEWDEFGNDLYAIPEAVQVQASSIVQDAPPTNKADEDSKIKALIDTPALDWQRQPQDAFGAGRGFGRGMGGRMMGGRGFGRGMYERKTPPAGYICHRCKIPGHFIQHCPTNGDPNYDIKKVKPPTGIPKSMLMATPDGSYALPSGAVAVLKPNEAAFEKEIEGLPSTRSVSDIPPELRCPLCKEVMKDAVLTSKCCFKSFCDKCIRDHIISKSMCVCGATNVLADDLLPNKTLRDTINRLLESNNSSAENAGSMMQVQDMESARPAQPKIPSPSLSAASKGEPMPPPSMEDNLEKETTNEANNASKVANAPQQPLEKGKTTKAADISEATHESVTVKETMSQGSAALIEEEVQQKPSVSEPGKKKKKKKVRVPVNGVELQWRTPQDVAAENYGMMPFGPSACNPYWGGMQLGMDGFMNPYAGAMPYMGYVPGPFDVPFGGIMPQDPFGAYMMPPVVPPQRDLSEFVMGKNPAPPVMSREEFEARKADLRRKREIERCVERDFPKDREPGREMMSSGDVSSMKPKHKVAPPPPPPAPESSDVHRHRHSHSHSHHHHNRSDRSPTPERASQSHHHHHRREERPSTSPPRSHHHHDRREERPSTSPPRSHHHHDRREERPSTSPPRSHHHRHLSLDRPPAPRPSANKRRPDPEDLPDQPSRNKRRSEPEDEPPLTTTNKSTASASDTDAERKKHKASVFSRISFPEDGGSSKKRKASSHSDSTNGGGGHKDVKESDGHHSPLFRSSSSNGPASASASASATVSKKNVVMDNNDSSDDERHFKRRPSRYEPTPPSTTEWDEQVRHSGRGGLKERERGHKHR